MFNYKIFSILFYINKQYARIGRANRWETIWRWSLRLFLRLGGFNIRRLIIGLESRNLISLLTDVNRFPRIFRISVARVQGSRFNGSTRLQFIASYWLKYSNQIDSRVNVGWVVRVISTRGRRSRLGLIGHENISRGCSWTRLWSRDKIDPPSSQKRVVVIIGLGRLVLMSEETCIVVYFIGNSTEIGRLSPLWASWVMRHVLNSRFLIYNSYFLHCNEISERFLST